MKNYYGVIILSNTANDHFYEMTMDCINSLKESFKKLDDGYHLNIVLVESNKSSQYQFPVDVNVIIPEEKFNYNKYLNKGINFLNEISANYITHYMISNNDVVYDINYFKNISNHIENYPDHLSISPYEPVYHYNKVKFNNFGFIMGYTVSFNVCGWSIMFSKEVLNKIGLFDEDFEFWYQDNDYAMKLKQNDIKHVLVENVMARHLISASKDLVLKDDYYKFTHGMAKIFKQKHSK